MQRTGLPGDSTCPFPLPEQSVFRVRAAKAIESDSSCRQHKLLSTQYLLSSKVIRANFICIQLLKP